MEATMRLITAMALLLSALSARAELPAPLAPYKGKLVYLDFWASWCGPCVQSFPWLNQMQEKYGKDLVVVGVNVDADPKAVQAFLKAHPAHFDIVRDPDGKLPELYKIEGMPSSVLIAPDGHVLHQHSGFRARDTAKYEAAIQEALSHEEASK
jgi:cytochrome c biogenesis protein CcmG, thiol:disulfide interchange protein DsbE